MLDKSLLPDGIVSAEDFVLMLGPNRQDTQRVTVQIRNPDNDQLINYGIWDKKSGGEVDTDIYKYKPGGMQPQVSLGGSKTIGDVTVSRLYRKERDHEQMQRFINWCGRARITISQHFLDTDGNGGGAPIVYVGVLKTVNIPDHDSESTDPAMVELVISPDGDPSAS